ncbi:hypothetical protein ISS96_02390 [Candidatus Bathyarchaeota archaeon]|nr:hypothetical protein [Candidatus Bathyarchaeota archaeon]
MVSIRDQALGRLQKLGATPAQAGIIIGNLNKMDLNKVLTNDTFARGLIVTQGKTLPPDLGKNTRGKTVPPDLGKNT